jgi:tetratricopeptide (TPR) repeat protein
MKKKNFLFYLIFIYLVYKLNKFDAAIQDCFDILLMDSKYILALSHRARCYLAKNQYDQANHDLDHILTIDPDNNEAQVIIFKIFN